MPAHVVSIHPGPPDRINPQLAMASERLDGMTLGT